VALVIALVLLVAVMLLSVAGISTTTLELRMATNQQARVNAFQQAQSGIAATKEELDNFRATGAVGITFCSADFHDSRYYTENSISCGSPDLILPAGFDLSYARIAVRRLPPLLQPAPRFIETSVEKLKVATFKIDSRYDARDRRGARSEHNQGLIVTVLTPSEETVITEDEID
jgi:hypothetical protein